MLNPGIHPYSSICGMGGTPDWRFWFAKPILFLVNFHRNSLAFCHHWGKQENPASIDRWSDIERSLG